MFLMCATIATGSERLEIGTTQLGNVNTWDLHNITASLYSVTHCTLASTMDKNLKRLKIKIK